MFAHWLHGFSSSLPHSACPPSTFFQVFQPMFEWLYKCVQLKSTSSEIFHFCLQFIPELVVIYLHSIYEDLGQVSVCM